MTVASMDGRFDVGFTISRTFDVLRRGAGIFVLLGLAFSAVPTMLVGLMAVAMPDNGMGQFLGTVALLVAAVPLTIGVVQSAAAIMDGDSAALGRPLAGLSQRFFAVLFLTLLTTVAICLGLFLLLVPGVFLALLWFVATPVLVLEGASVGEAFGRSAALTEGHRTTLLLPMLGALGAWLFVFLPSFMTGDSPAFLVEVIYVPVTSTFMAVLCTVYTVVAWRELRMLKGVKTAPKTA